ncbi:MAG TPA: ribosome maturation factor RimM [Anaeromyxobacteraceae bacterium]
MRIGKVVRPIGLHGFIGVAGTDGALGTLRRVALRREGEAEREYDVLEARPQGKLWAARLEGVATREEAEALVGCEVLAERAALGEAGQDRHFWADLEGLPVMTVGGELVGEVTGLLETGAVDVLVVMGARGEVLIPLAPYVTVDREAGRVVVDPPEGLLELAAEGREAKGGPGRGD